jgi:hypothetical protein
VGKKKAASSAKSNGSSANIGFEAKLWLAADKLRNNMDAAEYKHVVLGLIFLKYISDSTKRSPALTDWPSTTSSLRTHQQRAQIKRVSTHRVRTNGHQL